MEQIHSFLVEPGVTSIGNYACFALTHLEEVFLPDSVFHIGENAFGFCPVLQSIYIPDKLESIGEWCFKGCQSLTDCVLPEYLTTIGVLTHSPSVNLFLLSLFRNPLHSSTQVLFPHAIPWMPFILTRKTPPIQRLMESSFQKMA